MDQRKSLKPVYIAIVSFIAIIVLISIILSSDLFHKNPFGDEIKINNFSKIFKGTPTDTRDSIFAGLYNIANTNLQDQSIDLLKVNDAAIRADSSNTEFIEDTQTTRGSFIVDIPSIQQSYHVQFHWSPDPEVIATTGYTNIISCLPESELIYPAFSCKDFFNQNPYLELLNKYPLLKDLPLTIAYYSENFASYTNYEITYQTKEDDTSFIIIINDYTGGNYENALQKIRSLGYNPSDYLIQYNDESNAPTPGNAPNTYIPQ